MSVLLPDFVKISCFSSNFCLKIPENDVSSIFENHYQKVEKMPRMNNTIQRRIILEELRSLKSHPTVDELYRIVRMRLPQISLGTIYRNLSLLEESGKVRRIMSGRLARFDGDLSDHSHLCCEGCGAVEDFSPELSDSLKDALASCLQGRVRTYRLEYTGFCRACMERNTKNGV